MLAAPTAMSAGSVLSAALAPSTVDTSSLVSSPSFVVYQDSNLDGSVNLGPFGDLVALSNQAKKSLANPSQGISKAFQKQEFSKEGVQAVKGRKEEESSSRYGSVSSLREKAEKSTKSLSADQAKQLRSVLRRSQVYRDTMYHSGLASQLVEDV